MQLYAQRINPLVGFDVLKYALIINIIIIIITSHNHNYYYYLRVYAVWRWLLSASSQFAATIPRAFSVRYDPYTQSVQVINSMKQVTSFALDIKGRRLQLIIANQGW